MAEQESTPLPDSNPTAVCSVSSLQKVMEARAEGFRNQSLELVIEPYCSSARQTSTLSLPAI